MKILFPAVFDSSKMTHCLVIFTKGDASSPISTVLKIEEIHKRTEDAGTIVLYLRAITFKETKYIFISKCLGCIQK